MFMCEEYVNVVPGASCYEVLLLDELHFTITKYHAIELTKADILFLLNTEIVIARTFCRKLQA